MRQMGVECRICGDIFECLNSHITHTHHMATKKYKELYPDAEFYSEKLKKQRSKTKKKSNPSWREDVKKKLAKTRRKKKIEKICEFCGSAYKVIPSRKNSRFCSRECYFEHIREQEYGVKLTCDNCGKTFRKKPSHIWSTHNFCCHECYIEYRREGKIDVNHSHSITYPKPYFVEELGHKVRSSWEEKIGLILKEARIDYEYEGKRFELKYGGKTHYYTPDFILKGFIIEVKGYLRDRTKYPRFREKFLNWKFICVGKIDTRAEQFFDIFIPWENKEKIVEVIL